MPGKGLMVLIILFVAGSVVGLSYVDLTRDVPHYPPGYEELLAGGTPGAVARVLPTPPEDRGEPDEGQPEPPPEDEPATDEVRVRNVKLTKLSPDKTLPVIDEGDGKLVRIDITSEGAVLFGGINLGDWDFLVSSVQKKLREIPDAHIVVVPDRMVPWQYVYWLMDVIRESGATKVGLGGYPDYDEKKTLLVELEVALVPADTEVELPEGMTELVVELVKVEEGTGHYLVFEEQAEGLAALYPLVSGYNAEYADEYGAAYTKDPAKTPWVLKAPATMATGQVLVTLDAIRRAAVYTVRFGGDFPPPPGKGGK